MCRHSLLRRQRKAWLLQSEKGDAAGCRSDYKPRSRFVAEGGSGEGGRECKGRNGEGRRGRERANERERKSASLCTSKQTQEEEGVFKANAANEEQGTD